MENDYKYLNGNGEHVHLFRDQPLIGTSRVPSIIAKPLAWYGSGKAVETFGYPTPKLLTKVRNKKASQDEIQTHRDAMRKAYSAIQDMSIGEFAALIDQAYRAHDTYMRSRAKTGTDTHAECEKFIKYHMQSVATERVSPLVWPEEIRPFVDWTHANVKRFLWAEGHTFSEKLWIGGITDCGCEMKNGKYAIIDFKSTREAYTSQFIQIAAYDLQVSENGIVDANGNQLYTLEKPISEYHVFAFGSDKPQCYPYYDMEGARKAFQNTLALYNFLPHE